MGSTRTDAQRLLKRLNGDLPDPLELGRPSIAVPGKRFEWPANTRRVMSNGYVGVKLEVGPEGRCEIFLEHRLVLERELGRSLEGGESARHRSKNTLDNRPENLVLYRGNRPADLADAQRRSPRRRRRSSRPDYRWAYEQACAALEILLRDGI